MRRIIAVLSMLAAGTLSAVQVTGTYNGVRLSHANQYEYAPSIIQSGGVTRIWFCAGETFNGSPYNDFIHFSANWASSQRVLCPSEGGGATLCTNDYPSGPDHVHVCDPSVIKVNGVYNMYYTALNWENPPFTDENLATNYVFLARSSDGINWTKYPNSSQPPTPVITSGVHNGRYGTGQQSVVYKDGIYHMYYTNQPWWNESRIEHRTSSDGITFGNVESIYPEATVPNGAGTVDVKYIDGWNLWFLVSSGDDEPDSSGVYWNVSRDGRHWLPFSPLRAIPKGSLVAHNPGIIGNEIGHIGDGTIGPQTIEVAFGNGSAGDLLSDLGSSTITLTPEPLYGNFDGISASKIATGWAYDPDTGTNDAAANGGPAGPLNHSTYVSVWVDGVPQHNWQPSNVQRCDVRNAGLAPDCYHGFSIDLHGIVPAGTHTIRIEGGEFPSGGGGRMLSGSHTVTMP